MPGVYPTPDQNRARAKDNAAFADCLLAGPCRNTDWMVTALFYSAVHEVEALFRALGIPAEESDRHHKREELLKSSPLLAGEAQLFGDYRTLQDESEQARYYCARVTREEVRELRDLRLARIRARAQELTS